MTGSLQPLDYKYPIVDQFGRPTPAFIRWAQQRQEDIEASAEESSIPGIVTSAIQDFTASHPLSAGQGITISPPSGDLADDLTISADVQDVLNQLTASQGAILFKGASSWQVLAPGTAGLVLQTNGPAADPTWVPQSGGGGGGGDATYKGVPILGAGGTITAGNVSMVRYTPDEDHDIYAISVVFSALSAIARIAPVIYSSAGALLSTGPQSSANVVGVQDFPLTTSVSVTLGSVYYIGFQVLSAAPSVLGAAYSGAASRFASTTYPPPSTLPTISGLANQTWLSIFPRVKP